LGPEEEGKGKQQRSINENKVTSIYNQKKEEKRRNDWIQWGEVVPRRVCKNEIIMEVRIPALA
jgi:hypothetical protein